VLGAVGLKDLIVVDTQDAILVAHKENAQDVKKIYTALESKEHDSHLLHTTVARPWGTYCVLEEGIGYKIKRIVVNSGSSLSLQKHKHRSEHWVVVAGVATVRNGEEIMEIKTNQSTYIPAGTLHRLENKTNEELAIIEVQSGSYLGEDDIERFDDIYGR
jgi:mannose-1-phosphate guanylyltransferase